MTRRHAFLFGGALLLAVAALTASQRRHLVVAPGWQITGKVDADSLARALATRIGDSPDTLGSCGIHRIRIVYVNAPIDLPPIATTHRSVKNAVQSVGTTVDAGDPYFHAHVAQVIADAAWDNVAATLDIDTVTVKLVQKEVHAWPDEGALSYSDFNFVRDSRPGFPLRRAEPLRIPCYILRS